MRFSTLLSLGLAATLAGPALADKSLPVSPNLDRPDLTDMNLGFSGASGLSSSHANIQARGLGASYSYYSSPGSPGYYYASRRSTTAAVASGSAAGSASGTSLALTWQLYEPDRIKRKKDNVKLTQRDFVAFSLVLSGATSASIPLTAVSGCKATAKVEAADTAPTGHWKVRCLKDAFLALGLNQAQMDVVEAILGAKHKLAGKATNVPK